MKFDPNFMIEKEYLMLKALANGPQRILVDESDVWNDDDPKNIGNYFILKDMGFVKYRALDRKIVQYINGCRVGEKIQFEITQRGKEFLQLMAEVEAKDSLIEQLKKQNALMQEQLKVQALYIYIWLVILNNLKY